MQGGIGGKNIILRLEISTGHIQFGQLITLVNEHGGDVIAIDVISTSEKVTVRDITVTIADPAEIDRMIARIKKAQGVKVLSISDRTFLLHLGGKIEMQPKVPIQNRDDLSRVYTPDVARVCMAIHEEPDKAFRLTIKRNTVAVVSDGSAVLELGTSVPMQPCRLWKAKPCCSSSSAPSMPFQSVWIRRTPKRSLRPLNKWPQLLAGLIWRIFRRHDALRLNSGYVKS